MILKTELNNITSTNLLFPLYDNNPVTIKTHTHTTLMVNIKLKKTYFCFLLSWQADFQIMWWYLLLLFKRWSNTYPHFSLLDVHIFSPSDFGFGISVTGWKWSLTTGCPHSRAALSTCTLLTLQSSGLPCWKKRTPSKCQTLSVVDDDLVRARDYSARGAHDLTFRRFMLNYSDVEF